MSFSDDINKFVLKATSKIEEMQKEQKENIALFLQEKLGEEFNDLKSYKFDNEKHKFYDVDASESVITKLREAGYLREYE
jgi:hypothetical protein